MEKFTRIVKLEEGSFGTLYKARDKVTGQELALKKMKLSPEYERTPITAACELRITRLLEHPYVLPQQDVLVDEGQLLLSTEFLHMDLRRLMDFNKGPLRPDLSKCFLQQILKGVAYCHGRNLVHRDIKPQNLMVDSNGNIRVAYFGVARVLADPVCVHTQEVFNLWYRSPELLLGAKNYTNAVDIWSVGCVYIEMASGRPAFPSESEIDQLFHIFRALGTPGADVWPEAKQLPDFCADFPVWPERLAHEMLPEEARAQPYAAMLLDGLLRHEPALRLSAAAALDHPFLEESEDEDTP